MRLVSAKVAAVFYYYLKVLHSVWVMPMMIRGVFNFKRQRLYSPPVAIRGERPVSISILLNVRGGAVGGCAVCVL